MSLVNRTKLRKLRIYLNVNSYQDHIKRIPLFIYQFVITEQNLMDFKLIQTT